MYYKEDWEIAKKRLEAWWEGEIIDRAVLQITAPKQNTKIDSNWTGWELMRNLSNPGRVTELFEKFCQQTYFGGESFPNLWINLGPGIMAAYIGAEPEFKTDTVWFETPKNWDEIFNEVKFNPGDRWWNITKDVTRKITQMSGSKYFVGMTDIGGNLDVVSSLRGAQDLLYDLTDSADKVKELSTITNKLWFKYYSELHKIMQDKMDGTSAWMGIWSPKKWYPLQCDFAAMLSPKMFEEFVLPGLEEQCRWLDHSIYHLDGVGQVPHLDMLLEIKELNGIQWGPGESAEPVASPKWFPYYRKILNKNKNLVLADIIKPEQAELLVKEFGPKRILIQTYCNTEKDTKNLLKQAEKWIKKE